MSKVASRGAEAIADEIAATCPFHPRLKNVRRRQTDKALHIDFAMRKALVAFRDVDLDAGALPKSPIFPAERESDTSVEDPGFQHHFAINSQAGNSPAGPLATSLRIWET